MLRRFLLVALLVGGCQSAANHRAPTSGPLVPPLPQLSAATVVEKVSTGDPPDVNPWFPPKSAQRLSGINRRIFYDLMPDRSEVFYRLVILARAGTYPPQPSDAPTLSALLNDASKDIAARLCAPRFLLDLNDTAARSFVERQLNGQDRPALHNAADAVCEHLRTCRDDAWAIGALITVLSDDRLVQPYAEHYRKGESFSSDPDVYSADTLDATCWTLGRARARQAVPVLGQLVSRYPHRDEVPLNALAMMGDPAAAPVLLARLVDEKGRLREPCARGLGLLRSKDALPLLLPFVTDEPTVKDDTSSQQAAIEALGDIGDARAVPALGAYLAQRRPRCKFTAKLALAKIEAPDRGQAMIRLLDDETGELARGEVISELGRLKDRRAVGRLVRYAKNRNEYAAVRAASIHALGKIGGKEAVRGLVRLFDADFAHLKDPLKSGAESYYTWIGESLEEATGQHFGTYARRWQQWLIR